jgi:hypothetical protein
VPSPPRVDNLTARLGALTGLTAAGNWRQLASAGGGGTAGAGACSRCSCPSSTSSRSAGTGDDTSLQRQINDRLPGYLGGVLVAFLLVVVLFLGPALVISAHRRRGASTGHHS